MSVSGRGLACARVLCARQCPVRVVLWFCVSDARASFTARRLTTLSPTSSKVVRKSIARVLTVINQNKKDAARTSYADKILKPLDIRSATSPHEPHNDTRQPHRRMLARSVITRVHIQRLT